MPREMSLQRRLFCYQFLCKIVSYLDACYKTGLFVITAEGADWIDDPIHILQFHAVHGLVQGIKVGLDLSVVHRIHLSVGFVKKGQNRIAAAKVWRIVCQAGFELVEIGFHGNTSRSIWVMLTLNLKLVN